MRVSVLDGESVNNSENNVEPTIKRKKSSFESVSLAEGKVSRTCTFTCRSFATLYSLQDIIKSCL